MYSSVDRWVVLALDRTVLVFARRLVALGLSLLVVPFISAWQNRVHALYVLCHTNCCSVICSGSNLCTPQWETNRMFFLPLCCEFLYSELT